MIKILVSLILTVSVGSSYAATFSQPKNELITVHTNIETIFEVPTNLSTTSVTSLKLVLNNKGMLSIAEDHTTKDAVTSLAKLSLNEFVFRDPVKYDVWAINKYLMLCHCWLQP